MLNRRDEYDVLLPASETKGLKNMAFLLEEYLVQQSADLSLNLGPTQYKQAALHCHCHQKAFATAKDVETVLNWIPELTVSPITSSCCGMAGDFGQWAKTHDVSMAMYRNSDRLHAAPPPAPLASVKTPQQHHSNWTCRWPAGGYSAGHFQSLVRTREW